MICPAPTSCTPNDSITVINSYLSSQLASWVSLHIASWERLCDSSWRLLWTVLGHLKWKALWKRQIVNWEKDITNLHHLRIGTGWSIHPLPSKTSCFASSALPGFPGFPSSSPSCPASPAASASATGSTWSKAYDRDGRFRIKHAAWGVQFWVLATLNGFLMILHLVNFTGKEINGPLQIIKSMKMFQLSAAKGSTRKASKSWGHAVFPIGCNQLPSVTCHKAHLYFSEDCMIHNIH